MRTAIAIACAVALCAQAETIQEKGKRIVNEAVEALGGQNFLTMNDRVETGRAYSFYREKLSGLSIARFSTRYLNRVENPGKTLAVLVRQDFGKKFDYGLLFQQDDAYDVTFRGARPLADDRFQRYKDTTITDVFYILRERLKEPGLIMESRAADVWNNKPVEIVDITDANDQVVTIYFHQSTKLPVREIVVRLDPKTRERNEEITIYDKFRDVNGVQWPYSVERERNGEKIYQMFSDSVEINKSLPDTTFNLPTGIKKLKPE
ncbi:MAG TPA: hypothetical protein VKU01_24830 [Bryobacteraceae bacterium]|nr:hypothetical protein [Bryobacteraceae bacterium]